MPHTYMRTRPGSSGSKGRSLPLRESWIRSIGGFYSFWFMRCDRGAARACREDFQASLHYIRCMPQGRHLFVSDLHLDSAAPRAVATFLHFLSTDARRCDGLYILGDLFETWIGDDDDDAVQAQVCDALRALTGAGIPCHVQHGNRDFLLGAGFAARTGCTLLPDPFLFEGPAGRVVVSHGDALCTSDVAYQRFQIGR